MIKRCAIYTRKSTEEGLEQDFNSLDAQREACEAYIASQKARGLDAAAGRTTTTAASPAARWSARPCRRCCADIDAGQASTSSSSTRSTG